MKFIISLFIIVLMILLNGCKPTTSPQQQMAQQDNMYMVSHSEYWSGEVGQIIAHLLDYKGQPILNAICVVDVFYPNKTLFIQTGIMSLSNESYYYNFTTPSIEGVYEYKATCFYANNTKSRSVTNSFHLSPALNFIKISYDNLSNQITNLTDLSNAYFGNITYNLTQIKMDTEYIRENMLLNTTMTLYQNEVMTKLNILSGYCNDTQTSNSYLCQWVNETKIRLLNMNISVDNYLAQINQTTGATAEAISQLNQTIVAGGFTANDRYMLEKVYNCTILGIDCYLSSDSIWNYSGGRYTNGEQITP